MEEGCEEAAYRAVGSGAVRRRRRRRVHELSAAGGRDRRAVGGEGGSRRRGGDAGLGEAPTVPTTIGRMCGGRQPDRATGQTLTASICVVSLLRPKHK